MTTIYKLVAITVLIASASVGCGNDDDQAVFSNEIRLEQADVGPFTFDLRVAGRSSGTPVILLHGFPETSYEWRAQLPALAEEGYFVIAPDQRGYSPGASPSRISDYDLALLAGDILDIADTYGAETFHLVGHDWGAIVAWTIAGIAPDRVRTVTSLSIPHPDAFAADFADTTSCQYTASAYFDLFVSENAATLFLQNDAAFLRGIYSDFEDDTVSEYVAAFSEGETMQTALWWYNANVGARDITPPTLGSISVPTLFVWSDDDAVICRDTAERTQQFVDGPYEFVVLEGVDHWIPERAPDEINNLLLEHFRRH